MNATSKQLLPGETSEPEEELSATFWEHMDDLRRVFLCVISIILVGAALCITFYASLLHFFLAPLDLSQNGVAVYEIRQQRIVNRGTTTQCYTLPTHHFTLIDQSPGVIAQDPSTSDPTSRSNYHLPPGGYLEIVTEEPENRLALIGPLEGMKTTLKVCFWAGGVITSPFWLFFVTQFIAPAFRKSQRQLFIPFLGLSLLFLSSGALFAWGITLPLANKMFYAFNEEIGVNLWSYAYYVDYSLILMLANALAFEIALLLFFLVHTGVLTPHLMQKKRRIVVLAAFVVAAILTPPDVFTQVMLALPLIGLYEVALLYAHLRLSWAKRGPSHLT